MRAAQLLCTFAFACAGNDGFRDRLAAGCSGVAECERLESDARQRLAQCRGNCRQHEQDVIGSLSLTVPPCAMLP
jgi:hypothetical protein